MSDDPHLTTEEAGMDDISEIGTPEAAKVAPVMAATDEELHEAHLVATRLRVTARDLMNGTSVDNAWLAEALLQAAGIIERQRSLLSTKER